MRPVPSFRITQREGNARLGPQLAQQEVCGELGLQVTQMNARVAAGHLRFRAATERKLKVLCCDTIDASSQRPDSLDRSSHKLGDIYAVGIQFLG